jgi:transcription elongation factor Elf1
MTTIRQRYEEAHRVKDQMNSREGCPICGGRIEVEKEENYYILICKRCGTQIGEVV